MIVVLLLLTAVVLLMGVLTLTRLDRLERKIDELTRPPQSAASARPPHAGAPAQADPPPDQKPPLRPDPVLPHSAPQPEAAARTPASAAAPARPADLAARVPHRTARTAANEPAGTAEATPGAAASTGAARDEASDSRGRHTPPPVPLRAPQSPPPIPPSDRQTPQTPPAASRASQTPSAPRPTARPRKSDYEKYIGEKLFGRIGIFVLIVGVGFFVKYAIDNDWLGEAMRTALGFAVGAALLAFAARLRNSYRSFSSLLAGGAFAVCFMTTAIAYRYYGLFPQAWTFTLLVLLTLLMTLLAVACDRRELAVTALAGGLLAPFLASDGSGGYLFLLSYLSILHAGMFALSLYKKWWELPVVSFAATYLVLALFVADRTLLGGTLTQEMARHLLGFSTLFFLLFALSAVAVFRTENRKVCTWLSIVLTLNSFLYLGFGLLFLSTLWLSHKADGALPLGIAVVNAATFWGLRRRRCPAELATLLPALAVLFVTIAVPIQLQSNAILVCWAAEAVVLLVLYLRTRARVYDAGAGVLCLLTLTFGLGLLVADGDPGAAFCRSREFVSVFFAAAALGAAAWLTHRRRELFRQADYMRYTPVNALLIAGTFSLFYLLFITEFRDHLSGAAERQAILLFSVALLAATGRLLRRRFPIRNFQALFCAEAAAGVVLYVVLPGSGGTTAFTSVAPWLSAGLAALILADVALRYYRAVEKAEARNRFTLFLNLLATLLWTTFLCRILSRAGMSDANSAGFSIALITAGTVQMTLGMLRRRKVLRLFGLGVFALVLAKLLAYDLWQLPTIGRIAVFILLGAILLVLSFLYHRFRRTKAAAGGGGSRAEHAEKRP